MATTKISNGSRKRLPANSGNVCASCLRPRGNTRRNWEPITRAGQVVGWTCPDCPTYDEPIRREVAASKEGELIRYLAVLDGPPGPGGGRRQIKRRFWSLGEARAWVDETRDLVKLAAERRGLGDPRLLTVRQLCDRWIANRAKEVGTPGGIREVSLNGYRSALHAPLIHIGEAVAREVTTDDIEELLRTLRVHGGKWGRGLSHRSVAYALASLRLAFAYGVRQKWITSNPATEAKPPNRKKGDKRAITVWTPEQLAAFRDFVDQYAVGEVLAAEPWLNAGMRLTLCGLRRSEVLGLEWPRVHLDTGSIRVAKGRVKTGRGKATSHGDAKSDESHRVVPVESIHPGTAAALRALWESQGCPSDGLVIRDAVGQPVDPDTYSHRFRVIAKSAGVPDLGSIHNVRHSIATALHDDGVEPRKAASLLGHTVPTYLAFYVPTDDVGAAEAAKSAGTLFATKRTFNQPGCDQEL